MRRTLLLAATLLVALPALGAGWSNRNLQPNNFSVYEWRDTATDPPTAVDMSRCTKQIWQYTDDTTGLGDTAAGATLYHCTDPGLAFGDCSAVITFTGTTTGEELANRPGYYKLDVTAGTTTSASNARIQALCGGGNGPWTYSSGPPTTWTASGADRFEFQGGVGWAGDGNGSRIELEANVFAAPPVVTDDWVAFYVWEDNVGRPYPYAESAKLSCTDASDGSSSSRTCPETPTSGGTQTGGSADGYCDDFDTYGDCMLVQDRAPISTLRRKIKTLTATMGTGFMNPATSGFSASKCLGWENGFSFTTWCNGSEAYLVAPEDSFLSIEDITITWKGETLATTLQYPPDESDCMVFIGYHPDRNAANCNRPNIDSACSTWLFEPLVHTGDGATSVGSPQLLDTFGETFRKSDFDEDGDSEDADMIVEGQFTVRAWHRHECNGTTTSPGEPCLTAADCTGAAPTCSRKDGTPFACMELQPLQVDLTYSTVSQTVEP